ncbi:RNA polymerase sigma factor [Streptomyces sp. NBC_01276]|uniref:RNA polymerase sigma factor n=1 Tax=Streptomyces sp. NBC_01276 TaxID=2903808 RepID=UPI00352C493E
MTSFPPFATPCLNCAAPVDLLDAEPPAGDGPAEYLDSTRWCGRCMRYLDDWDRFFLLYQPRLRSFCLRKLQGFMPNEDFRQVAEDIVQETMIIAYRHFDRWDRPERAIWRTARNEISGQCSAYRMVTADGFPLTIRHVSPTRPEDFGFPPAADPAEAVIGKVTLYSALSRLPRPQQEALLVHTALQVPAAAAGVLLARPASTVKTHAQSGRKTLREAAAKGALVILPGAALVGLYKILEQVPFEAAASGGLDLLTRPDVYPVVAAAAARYGIGYLRDRYLRARYQSRPDAPDTADATGARIRTTLRDRRTYDKERHRGAL